MLCAHPIPLLQADDLTAVLAGDAGAVRVLDHITFALGHGEVVDVVGPSGSGKSTFLRALARLLPNATGALTLAGRRAEDYEPQDWRRRVSLLPQKTVVGDGSVRDDLLLPWRFKVRDSETPPSETQLLEALDVVGLEDIALDRDAIRLSVGQQGRLGFARLWLTSPTVLLLDEADAALDDESSEALSRAVTRFSEKGGTAVVRVRHRADDGLAARRLRLAAGRLDEVER